MDIIVKLNELRELADKIIINEEWCELWTVQYNATGFNIESGRTGKKVPIKVNDTEKSIREKIELVANY